MLFRSVPLTASLKGSPKILNWSTQAENACSSLKEAFTMAPVPAELFIVKVEALETGIGAVLSQHSGNPPMLHPIAFYSYKLSHTHTLNKTMG